MHAGSTYLSSVHFIKYVLATFVYCCSVLGSGWVLVLLLYSSYKIKRSDCVIQFLVGAKELG